MIEVEIKLLCKDINLIRSKLVHLGAEFIRKEHNQDTYLNHPHKDFAVTDEALRIRKVNSHYELTYKGPKSDLKSKTRIEISTPLDNDTIFDIFDKLGFKISGFVDKIREIWHLNSIVIMLDDVKELGQYIELELEAEQPKETGKLVEVLYKVAIELDLDPQMQIRKSYLELLQEKEN